jgi:hypothetical protein
MSKFISAKTIGLLLLSASVLAFEVTLTRLFAFQQFHHFAFVVISLAVMGFAGSGLILSLRRKLPSLLLVSVGYSTSISLAYLTINFLPFDSYSIGADSTQIWILLLYFSATGAPFLLAGLVIGSCLTQSGTEAHRPYATNFVGSAVGCLLAIVSISVLGGESTVLISLLLGLLAAAAFSTRRSIQISLLCTAVLLTFATSIFTSELSINPSPYKPLSITRLFPDAQESLSEWSISTRLDVIETNSVHVFPGLSLNYVGIPPTQAGFFIDGDGPIPITNLSSENPLAIELASRMPSGLAHRLRPNARMLILQPGGGLELVFALASGANEVTLALDEPLILDALQGPYLEFTHGLLANPRVSISSRTSRGTLASNSTDYDIILFALTDSFRPITSGAFSLSENYDLTVDSFVQAIESLSDDGILVITRWLGTPPSESARAWTTLITALELSGISNPSSHLAAFREMRTGTMLASPKAFSQNELAVIREFLEQNSYDPIHLPDLSIDELNQHNRLPEDTYYLMFRDLINDPELILESYDFNLRAPVDDKPFFYHFFRWRQTPEILSELGFRWQPFGGSGYLVLLALLGLMVLLAVPLAIIPILSLTRREKLNQPGWKIMLYFGFLGAGYLLIEIPLIQQFTLYLDRPAIAFAVVLFSMLISSGAGSWFSNRIPLRKTLLLLSGYLLLLILISPIVIDYSLHWSSVSRIFLTLLLISPAGFMMGIPFASGLRELEKVAKGTIPWAWAINGAVSGISGVLAAMVSLDLGLRITMIIGSIAYAAAYLSSSEFE